jgi:transposase
LVRVIGLDLSDKKANVAELDADPTTEEVVATAVISLTETALRKHFGTRDRCRVALEVGSHSPWVSRLLNDLGHQVIIANPREIEGDHRRRRKSDRIDAEKLARLARVDPRLLHPIQHRSESAQAHLTLIRARDVIVRTRATMINAVRGIVKPFGARVPACSADIFPRKAALVVPPSVRAAVYPLLAEITRVTRQIRYYDQQTARLAKEQYPETERLTQITGVGTLTALAYRLTIDDPARFRRSRAVGPYLGLTPSEHSSGEMEPELGISKAGDPLLRRLLVQCAHYILGPFGPDCDLRRWGLGHAGSGSKSRKKKAVAAVARKLAVLLHHLWTSGDVYEPLHNTSRTERMGAA